MLTPRLTPQICILRLAFLNFLSNYLIIFYLGPQVAVGLTFYPSAQMI